MAVRKNVGGRGGSGASGPADPEPQEAEPPDPEPQEAVPDGAVADDVPPEAAADTQPVDVGEKPAVARTGTQQPAFADTQPVDVGAGRAEPAGDEAERALLLQRLTALEAENAHLRAMSPVAATAPGGTPVARGRRRYGRTAAAVVLILLGALLAPVAVTITWAKTTITDTDRYLATIGPLVDDPAVQAAVTNRVTGAIVDAINLDDLVAQGTSAVADLGLPPRVTTLLEGLGQPIVNAATNFIHTQVQRLVTSDTFANAWLEANRTAHQQLIGVLEGDPDAIASIDSSGTLNVDLTTVIDAVKQSLSDRGFTIVNSLPTIHASFPLVKSNDLVKLKNAYNALDLLGTWLPWIVVALFAGGVMCAYRRARALVAVGLAFAGAMLATGLAIGIGRSLYLHSLPSTIQRPDAAANVFDQLVSFLKVAIRTGFVLGIVIAIVAFLAGGSAAAAAVRGVYTRSTAWVRGLGDRHGVGTGAVGVWLDEQRVLIRVVVAIGAALALVLAGHLTPKYVLGVAIVALLVLGVVQLLSRPSDDRAGRSV